MTPSETDLAWLAGIFDGEGSVNLSLRVTKVAPRGAFVLRARICNTHLETVERVRDIVGAGSVRIASRRTVRNRRVYGWAVEAKTAVRLLEMIQPYSVTKAGQIALALEAVELRKTAPRVNRGTGGGKGAPSISPGVRARLLEYAENIKRLNGHKRVTA